MDFVLKISMAINQQHYEKLSNFFLETDFAEHGAVITDLDGTAIHEHQGIFLVPKEVELGLKKIYDLGRPIVINTLRFPLSVINTFGEEWYSISNAPIPTVLMNGSQLGFVVQDENGQLGYEEITAFPLKQQEIMEVMQQVRQLVEDGLNDLLVFYYPRQWQKGEIIWTPDISKTSLVQQKYLSASKVFASQVSELERHLLKEDICMIFLLVEIPEDKLMAYQHTRKSNFFTSNGIDKLSGAKEIARILNFKLPSSLGAGDTEMDSFLQAVGAAIQIGPNILPYKGEFCTLNVQGSAELGDILFELASMQKTALSDK